MIMIYRSLRLSFIAAILAGAAVSGCKTIDDDRIPPVAVNVVFTTDGMWSRYGVGGALETRRFIKSQTSPEPADFPYAVSSYTGFGGVLLCGDLYGNPVAYDLACPYEAKATVRIAVDNEAHNAYCPICKSTYDIFGGEGRPTSGPAADRGYGLARYHVIDGGVMNYRVITR